MKNIVRLLLLVATLHTPNIMPSQEPNRPQKRSAGVAELEESENAKKQKTEAEGLPAAAAASSSLSAQASSSMEDVLEVSTSAQRKQLFDNVYNGRLEEIIKHLERYPQEINFTDEKGNTALDYVIQRFSPNHIVEEGEDDEIDLNDKYDQDKILSSIKYLLSRGATFNANTIGAQELLVLACQKDDLDFIKLLLQRGVDINSKDSKNQTPLMRACQYLKIDTIKLLLADPRIDINAMDDAGYTALTYLIENFSEDWYDSLDDDYSADINNSETRKQAIQAVQLLIDRGVNVDGGTLNALIMAADRGIYEVVEALMVAEVDTSVKDSNGETAIDSAKERLDETIENKKEVSDEIVRKQYDQLIHAYRKIILLLSNKYHPARMNTAREELINRIPTELIPIMREYLRGPDKPEHMLINDIKVAIESDDMERLMELAHQEPLAFFATDEAGDTPLALAIKWRNPIIADLIAETLNTDVEEKIAQYDEYISKIKNDIQKAHPKMETQLTDMEKEALKKEIETITEIINRAVQAKIDQLNDEINNIRNDIKKEALKKEIDELNKMLERNTVTLNELSDEELAREYNHRIEQMIPLYEKRIEEYTQKKIDLIKQKENEFDNALKLAHALGNQEIITMLEQYTAQQDVPMPQTPAASPIEPLVLIPNEFVQDLIMGDKNAHEDIEYYLVNFPEYLNGVDKHGNTPLIIAAEHANDVVVETLLQRGANINARNNAGKTALDMATESLAIANDLARRERLEHIIEMIMQQP